MNIAVIGGGINGLCIAWFLIEQGGSVVLYEKGKLLSGTSSASTKLLHGGLRYLEQGAIKLVKEALRERAWWLKNVPQLTQRIELFFPINNTGRSRWLIKLGLWLYDRLAGEDGLGDHQWLDIQAVKMRYPSVRTEGLIGGYIFYDGQMDDYALGMWVSEKIQKLGVDVHEHTMIRSITTEGEITLGSGETIQYDCVINATGPWVEKLLRDSGIPSKMSLDLVRGSHILLDRTTTAGFLLQHPEDGRIIFVLPYQGKTLIGTTEIRQSLEDPISCSDEEKQYLIDAFNTLFLNKISNVDIVSEFSGVRPLLKSSDIPGKTSREYFIESNHRLVNVWGGKWTTARALARSVAKVINRSKFNSASPKSSFLRKAGI